MYVYLCVQCQNEINSLFGKYKELTMNFTNGHLHDLGIHPYFSFAHHFPKSFPGHGMVPIKPQDPVTHLVTSWHHAGGSFGPNLSMCKIPNQL